MNHRSLLLQALTFILCYQTKTTSHAAEVFFFSKTTNYLKGNKTSEPDILLDRLRQLISYSRPTNVKVESSYPQPKIVKVNFSNHRKRIRVPRSFKPKNIIAQNARQRKYRATSSTGSYRRIRGHRGNRRNPSPISPPPISPRPPTAPPAFPSYRFEKIDKTICANTVDSLFGYNLVLSEQGKRVAISAPDHNGPNGAKSGMVQVYENKSGTWNQIGSLYGSNADASLGISGLTISDDGNFLGAVELTNQEPFSASVYKFNTNGWSKVEEYAGRNDASLSNDGSRVALGNNNTMQLFNLGVTPEIGEVVGDYDTVRVVLSGDGKIAAMYYNPFVTSLPDNSGVVKVYKYDDARGMSMVGPTILGPKQDSFGSFVSLSYSGDTIAIGGDNYAQILKFNGGTWEQKGNNIVGIGDETVYGAVRVSLADSGDRIVVGYPRSPNANEQQQGGVMVFEFHNNSWKQIGGVIGEPNSFMGYGVSISSEGSFFAASSPVASNGIALTGCVEVYQIVRN